MNRLTKFSLTVLMLFMLVIVIAASSPKSARAAGSWYVAPGGSDGNTCLSAVSPCATINGALGKASPGDTVLIATGTYTGTGTEVVTLNISVTLSGGWNSGFTTQTGMSTVDGQAARRGLTVSGGAVTVERFTIQNGLDYSQRGGIYNGATLTLNSSTVRDSNLANGSGGGIRNVGTLTLNNSTVSGNVYGIVNESGTLTLNNSSVNGNLLWYGGCGVCGGGTMTINNSTVSGNTRGIDYISNGGKMTLTNSTVSGNTLGISISTEGKVTLNNSTVSDNVGSGGINNGGTLTLTNSTINGNTSQLFGGIYNNGTLLLNNSTISGNTGLYGGGIFAFNGSVTINSSTLSGNTAANAGGGIFNDLGVSVTLQNSIVAGNTSAGTGTDCNGLIRSSGYNLIGTTSGCTFTPGAGDLINVDPRLSPLQNNGGSTPTHALLPGSPAINAGNPGGCMGSFGLLTADQRGMPRFGRCDIGAYELQPFGFSTKTVNASTFTPGQPLTYTIALTNGGASAITNILVTDTLPINLTYNSNSLIATNGTYGFDSRVITWTGSLNADGLVTITFGATVNQTGSLGSIVNTAIISGGGAILKRSATFNVDGQVCNLTKYTGNPVLTVGANGAWDDAAIWRPAVLKVGGTYKIWYSASDGTTRRIGLATSPDGITWTKSISNPVLDGVYAPTVIYDGGLYKMWYREFGGSSRIGYATSPDGSTWTIYGGVLAGVGIGSGNWEAMVTDPTVIKSGGLYHLWYVGNDGTMSRIGHATSTDGLNWVRDAANPVLNSTPGDWDWLDVYGPSVVKVGDEFKLWYSGDTLPPASQTGYATSLDGSTWMRQQKLISEGPLNAFDAHSADYPAVIVDGGEYKIWYSGINSNGTYNIGYATAGVCSASPPMVGSNLVYLPLLLKGYSSCQAYYTDNFSDPNSGWLISDDANRKYAYTGGQYQIQVKTASAGWYASPGAKARDFTASVSARRASGSTGAYGILFGLDGNQFEFYEVLIDANTYSIWHYIALSWSPLQNWTSSPFIATGTNWNRLKVVRSGATISFYVNNHLLTSVSNSSTFGGTLIGLTAESDNTALDARFDDFSLYPASCGATAYAAASSISPFELGKPEARQVPIPPQLPQP